MCKKAFKKSLFSVKHAPDRDKTQQICEKVI